MNIPDNAAENLILLVSESDNETVLIITPSNQSTASNPQAKADTTSPPQTPTITRKQAGRSSTLAIPSRVDVENSAAIEGESISKIALISSPDSRPTTPAL